VEPRSAEMIRKMAEHWSGTEQLQIEGRGSPGFEIARVWNPRGCALEKPRPRSSRGVDLLLIVEGGGLIRQDGRVLECGRGDLVVLDEEPHTVAHFSRPTVTYAWMLGERAQEQRWIAERLGEVLPVDASFWAPARAMMNGLLDGDPVLAEQPAIARAGEALLKELVASSAPRRRSRADAVYGEAMALIEERHRDPALTAARLARELLVSEPTLARAFSFLGRTAEDELERRRAGTLLLLIGGPSLTTADFVRAAEEAGFASAESARRALRRLSRHR
jgi:AraC-like DNA-binding protein